MNVIQKKMTILLQKLIPIDYTLENVFIIIYIPIIMNNIPIIVSTLAPIMNCIQIFPQLWKT